MMQQVINLQRREGQNLDHLVKQVVEMHTLCMQQGSAAPAGDGLWLATSYIHSVSSSSDPDQEMSGCFPSLQTLSLAPL